MRSDPVSCTSVDGRPEDADAGSVKARKPEHLRARYGNKDPTFSGTILRSPIFRKLPYLNDAPNPKPRIRRGRRSEVLAVSG